MEAEEKDKVTLEERAKDVAMRCQAGARLVCESCILMAIKQAVAEEREACARLAEEVADHYRRPECRQVAAEIRARGDVEGR